MAVLWAFVVALVTAVITTLLSVFVSDLKLPAWPEGGRSGTGADGGR